MDIIAWAEQQKAALIEAGVHPLDAEAAVQWVVDNLPPGEDPNSWLPAQEVIADTVRRAIAESTADAKSTWYAADEVPQRYKMLLSATPVESEEEARGAKVAVVGLMLYFFVRNRSRYYTAAPLRPVATRNIRQLLDDHIGARENALAELVTAYQEGRVAPAVWYTQMRVELRRLHLTYRALGAGGLNNLTAEDLLAVDAALMGENVYLHGFARAIRAGELTAAQAQARVQMYVGTARVQFWQAEREHAAVPAAGMVLLERRILRPAEHCRDCLDLYDRGWQRMGALPVPGDGSTQCRSNDRCLLDRREVAQEEMGEWLGTKR